jgi:hypothetical protein
MTRCQFTPTPISLSQRARVRRRSWRVKVAPRLPNGGQSQQRATEESKSHCCGFWNRTDGPVRDGVRIECHRAITRQGACVQDGCAGGQGDARERENMSFERRACTERGGTTNLPKHIAPTPAATPHTVASSQRKARFRAICGRFGRLIPTFWAGMNYSLLRRRLARRSQRVVLSV